MLGNGFERKPLPHYGELQVLIPHDFITSLLQSLINL